MSYYKSLYTAGEEFVDFSGNKYTVITGGTTPSTPFNKNNIVNNVIIWGDLELQESVSTGVGISSYASGITYNVDDIVIYNGKIYQCTTSHTATSTFDDTKWTEISASESVKGLDFYTSGVSYEVNDIVVYDNKIYKCSTAHTSTNEFDSTKWTEISAGGDGICSWSSGTSYSSGDLVIKDNVLYQANTTTSTTWVDSEWDVIGTTFNTTSTYAQKIVTNVVAPYEMLLQVGDSNYCKPPIDVLKKTGGSANVTLTLENYNNASAYTGTSDFLKIENSKAKLYNYKEYPITTQTLSTIDIGVSDEVDFNEFIGGGGGIDDNTLVLLHFNGDSVDEVGNTWTENGTFNYTDGKFGSALSNTSSTIYLSTDAINFSSSDFTIEFWWKLPVQGSPYFLGNASMIFNCGTGCLGSYISAQGFHFDRIHASNGFTIPASLSVYQDGNYHHIAIVRNINLYTLYVDGLRIAEVTSNIVWANETSLSVLGDSSSLPSMIGNIDEFRISNIARWTSEFTPSTEPYTRPNYNISSLEVN